jgi:hypothetical protein
MDVLDELVRQLSWKLGLACIFFIKKKPNQTKTYQFEPISGSLWF